MRSKESERRIQLIIEKIRESDAAHGSDDSLPDLCDDEPDDYLAVLPVLIADIENHVGGHLLDCLDPVLIGEFCNMSVTRNEGTGHMLRSLIDAFMHAYSNFDTSDQAVQALLFLENLAENSPNKPH
jgi:hypothetical protein